MFPSHDQGETNRLNTISDVSNSIPLLQRQMESDDLSSLMQAFGILPTGQASSGNQLQDFTNTTSQRGTQLIPGNMTAGALSGLGQGLFAPINAQGGTSLDMILKQLFVVVLYYVVHVVDVYSQLRLLIVLDL